MNEKQIRKLDLLQESFKDFFHSTEAQKERTIKEQSISWEVLKDELTTKELLDPEILKNAEILSKILREETNSLKENGIDELKDGLKAVLELLKESIQTHPKFD